MSKIKSGAQKDPLCQILRKFMEQKFPDRITLLRALFVSIPGFTSQSNSVFALVVGISCCGHPRAVVKAVGDPCQLVGEKATRKKG